MVMWKTVQVLEGIVFSFLFY